MLTPEQRLKEAEESLTRIREILKDEQDKLQRAKEEQETNSLRSGREEQRDRYWGTGRW